MSKGKDEKMQKVAEQTNILLNQHGLQGLSFSRVARAAGVSRSWLYKYIGNSKEDLINFAVDSYGKVFASLEKPIVDFSREAWANDRLATMSHMLEMAEKNPWITSLYFRYRQSNNELGKRMEHIEGMFLEKAAVEIKKVFQLSSLEDARLIAEILTALRLGIVHRWAVLGLSQRTKREKLFHYLEMWFKRSSAIKD